MGIQTIVSKIFTLLGQVALAWFLTREDFGLVALAYMFSIVPYLLQQGGIREVLIRRQRCMHLWTGPAFWMSMTLGVAGGALMALIAPIATSVYNEPRLGRLLLIIALLFPLESAIVVPMAQMYSQMRFRLVAAATMAQTLLQTILMVAFAATGFGVYSILLPRIVVCLLMIIACWWIAPARISSRPQIGRWRFLMADGIYVIAANGVDLLLLYGGILVLSLIRDTTTVGLYYFAFNIALQTMFVLSQSLGGVLFPALSHLQDTLRRQTAAFLRTLRLLALFAFPTCLMQAVLAGPAVRLVFPERWEAAIPLVQMLSVGMAARAIGIPAVSLLQAQGRFQTRLLLSLASLGAFAVMVVIGGLWWGELGVAVAVAAHLWLTEPVMAFVAIRGQYGGRLLDLHRALSGPLAIAVLVALAAAIASIPVPYDGAVADFGRATAMIIVSIPAFWLLARRHAPEALAEVMSRIRGLLAK